jgi:ATP-dependent Clp protease ATP-binding subunit ClpX
MEELTLSQLIQILTCIRNNFIDQYRYLFSIDGIELTFTRAAIEKIAQNCIDIKTGARGLHTEIERVLMPAMFHIRKYKEIGVTELVVTTDHVDDPGLLVAEHLPPKE